MGSFISTHRYLVFNSGIYGTKEENQELPQVLRAIIPGVIKTRVVVGRLAVMKQFLVLTKEIMTAINNHCFTSYTIISPPGMYYSFTCQEMKRDNGER